MHPEAPLIELVARGFIEQSGNEARTTEDNWNPYGDERRIEPWMMFARDAHKHIAMQRAMNGISTVMTPAVTLVPETSVTGNRRQVVGFLVRTAAGRTVGALTIQNLIAASAALQAQAGAQAGPRETPDPGKADATSRRGPGKAPPSGRTPAKRKNPLRKGAAKQ